MSIDFFKKLLCALFFYVILFINKQIKDDFIKCHYQKKLNRIKINIITSGKEKTLKELFNDPKYCCFRKNLKANGGTFGACQLCCELTLKK